MKILFGEGKELFTQCDFIRFIVDFAQVKKVHWTLTEEIMSFTES